MALWNKPGAMIDACEDIHLTSLNKEKCKFAVTYIGHKLTPQGVHPNPKRSCIEMPAPSDKKVLNTYWEQSSAYYN